MNPSMQTQPRRLSDGSLRFLTLGVLVAVIVILLDVLTKWLISEELGPGGSRESIQLLGNFIELHYMRNSGVAFGLLSGSSMIAGILVGIVIVPLLVVLVVLAGRGGLWAVAAGMVLGGAMGNIVDRIDDQQVTDFISIGRWPSFNLADSAITVGALLLIGLSFRDRDQKEEPAGGR